MNEEKKVIKTAKCIRAGVPVQTCDDDYIVLLNIIEKQQKEIEELNKNKQQINYNEIFSPDFVEENFISKDKIRKIINKYVDVDEHLEYANQELYGEDLRNMINELLKEE